MMRGVIKAVRRSLLVDSLRLAKEAATKIEACLKPPARDTDPHGAYAILKCWYRHASARSLNPSQSDMEKFKEDFQTLYQREDPHTLAYPWRHMFTLSK